MQVLFRTGMKLLHTEHISPSEPFALAFRRSALDDATANAALLALVHCGGLSSDRIVEVAAFAVIVELNRTTVDAAAKVVTAIVVIAGEIATIHAERHVITNAVVIQTGARTTDVRSSFVIILRRYATVPPALVAVHA